MESIKIFQNEQFGKVRVAIDENGEPMFAGVDIATILGYENPRKAIRDHVDEEDRRYCQLSDFQGRNETLPPHMKGAKLLIVNESGVYSLILRSKLPQAKEFKKWVTSEVLPSIRKHGAYMTEEVLAKSIASPDYAIGLLLKLKETQEKARLAELEAKIAKEDAKEKSLIIEKQAPLVNLGDAVMKYGTDITINELSKLLCQNGINIGERRLRSKLKDAGYLNANGQPSQKSVEAGWMAIVKGVFDHPIDGLTVYTKTMITAKGQKFFINKFLKPRRYAN